MLDKLKLYFHTLRYLKSRQIGYRLKYMLRRRVRKITGFSYNFNLTKKGTQNLNFTQPFPHLKTWTTAKTFHFLNLEKRFDAEIDWNYPQFGKLWTYNLNYFEFLHQPDINTPSGLQLIRTHIKQTKNLKDGLEPFPISLRIINWIKFIVQNNIQDTEIDNSIFCQLKILEDNLEYHLLGNHLLENGFCLLFAGVYFNDEHRIKQAYQLLKEQLEEQTLDDGGHFERSPMYHQLMLYRVLDCIQLVRQVEDQKIINTFLTEVASKMLGWLQAMTFANGTVPRLNDSAVNVAPSSKQLFSYAKQLNITPTNTKLNGSGYRKMDGNRFEMIVDVGDIGPDYLPGHAHSDTFNFVVQVDQQPFIVDTGISTYEANDQRQVERSTSSHNTVAVNDQEQSQIWGSFRVAKRAKITALKATENNITATHNGYKEIGVLHTRSFSTTQNNIRIEDQLSAKPGTSGKAYFHFHPTAQVELIDNVLTAANATIKWDGATAIKLESYKFAAEFNKLQEAQKVIITFAGNLNSYIQFNENSISNG